MKIHIPNSSFLGNINNFLSTLDTIDDNSLSITTNPKWVSVHPLVVTMIAALGKKLPHNKIICSDITATSGHYLKRIGLFEFLGVNPKVKQYVEHEPAGRLIPLTQIRNSEDLENFLRDLVPLLHLDRDPKHAHSIQHIFSELIRNVLEHARTDSGAIVCAQYFKKSDKIAIGVSDVGIGLKNSLSQSYDIKDSLQAIQYALTPGITGTTNRPGGTSQNAGFGLFLIKSIAYVNSDHFVIISGDKMYKLLRRNEAHIKLRGNPLDDKFSTMNISSWPGVAIGVDISLSKTKEFDTLLGLIYNFYSKEVGTQKKARYKKPKFI